MPGNKIGLGAELVDVPPHLVDPMPVVPVRKLRPGAGRAADHHRRDVLVQAVDDRFMVIHDPLAVGVQGTGLHERFVDRFEKQRAHRRCPVMFPDRGEPFRGGIVAARVEPGIHLAGKESRMGSDNPFLPAEFLPRPVVGQSVGICLAIGDQLGYIDVPGPGRVLRGHLGADPVQPADKPPEPDRQVVDQVGGFGGGEFIVFDLVVKVDHLFPLERRVPAHEPLARQVHRYR